MSTKTKVRAGLAGVVLLLCGLGSFTALNADAAGCPQHGPQSGYGRCGSCYCRRFEGNSNTCYNCGHNYSRHY
jgi:hypothetical protein